MRKRNSALRAANKDLKSGSGPEAMAAVEHRASELQFEVDRLNVELKTSEQRRKDIEQEINTAHARLQEALDIRAQLEEEVLSLTEAAELLQSKLKAEGTKAQYLDSAIEDFPFTEHPKDENVKMDLYQPFDDNTTPEK
ncbi:hypothetical protein BHM03_00005153 [Ensete ventricosum]|nr:hypothetical protein BHM03_00005153 [Ensete ventricosum]